MTEQEQPMTQVDGLAYIGIRIKEHTREGATSDIMMNGTGPRPTANDLGGQVSREGKTAEKDSHHEDKNRHA